jgi:outer membrane immunogenic protein
MKKLMLALTALAAFTGSAVAADLPARTYSKAPAPVVAVQSWTGLWISGGFGYGLMDIDHSVTGPVAPFPAFDIGHDNGGRGWLGKFGVGGDYQFAGPMGNWVVGAFADAQFSDIKGNYSFNCPGGCLGPTGYIGQLKNDWSWVVGGRIGYVALPGLSPTSTAVTPRRTSSRSTMLTPRTAPSPVVLSCPARVAMVGSWAAAPNM